MSSAARVQGGSLLIKAGAICVERRHQFNFLQRFAFAPSFPSTRSLRGFYFLLLLLLHPFRQ